MDDIIEATISDDEIARFANAYEVSKQMNGETETVAKFQFATALLKSSHKQDVLRGISLLENLYYDGNLANRRDYLYYIAIGHTRLKDYNLALDCVEHFLSFEPDNQQATKLRAFIKEKMTKDGLMGMAIAGGAVIALGSIIGIGLSMAKK